MPQPPKPAPEPEKERDHHHPLPRSYSDGPRAGSPRPLSPLSGFFPSEEGARGSSLVAGSDAAALSQAAPRRQRRRRRCSLARPVAVTARRRLRRLRFPDRPGARQPPQLAGRSHRFCSCRRRRHHGARGCSPAGGLGALSPSSPPPVAGCVAAVATRRRRRPSLRRFGPPVRSPEQGSRSARRARGFEGRAPLCPPVGPWVAGGVTRVGSECGKRVR